MPYYASTMMDDAPAGGRGDDGNDGRGGADGEVTAVEAGGRALVRNNGAVCYDVAANMTGATSKCLSIYEELEAFYDALGGTWHRDAAAAHASHLQVRVLRAELPSLPPPDEDELSSLATPLPSDDDDSDGDESDDENDPASPASRLFNKAMTALLGGEYAGELCERE